MPKPGLWNKMLAAAFRQVKWEPKEESDEMLRLERQEAYAKPLNPELVKLTEMIEDAFREEQMAESGQECLLGMGTDWIVKLGDGRKLRQPFERKRC